MSEWRLNIPYRSRDQGLGDLAVDANSLSDPEERATVLALIERALLDTKLKTAGELIGSIEALDRDGRRRLLDECRQAAGLESASDLDAHAEFEMAQDTAAPRLIPGGAIQIDDPAEIERERRRDALLAEEDRARREQRAVDARERAAARQAADQAWRPRGPKRPMRAIPPRPCRVKTCARGSSTGS